MSEIRGALRIALKLLAPDDIERINTAASVYRYTDLRAVFDAELDAFLAVSHDVHDKEEALAVAQTVKRRFDTDHEAEDSPRNL